MWLRFNKYGVLQEYLTHGNPARVGNTNFQIFAVFEDIDIENYFSNATIRFQRPDLQGSEYPNLFMQRVELTYEKLEDDSDSTYFVNGHTYTGFLFNFNDFVANSEDRIILLDTPGMWEASITLLGANSELNVQGIIAFNVQESVSMADDEAQVVDVAIIVSNIAQLLGNTIKKDDLYYEKVCEDFEEKATSGQLSKNIFNVGSIVYDPTNNNVYKILTITNNDEDETKVSATYTLISTLNFVDLSLVTLPSDYSVSNLLNALNEINASNSGVYLVKFANDYATLIRTYHGYYTEFAIYGKENIYLANSVDITNLNQFEVRKKLNDSDLSFVDLSSVIFPSEYLVSNFQSALNEAHSGEGVYLVKFSNNYAFVHRESSGYAWNYTVYCRNKKYIGSSQDSTLNDFVLKSGDVAILTDVNGETTLAQLQTKLEGIGFANLGVISQTTGGTIDFTESLIQFEDYGGGGIGCFIVTPRMFFRFSVPAGNIKLKEAEQYGLHFYSLATKKELNDNLVVIELSDSVDTGTLSDSDYDLIANAKNCVILRNGIYYRKYNDYQGTINYQSGVSKTTATGKEALNWYGIAINKSTKVWTYTYHEGNYHYTVAGADGKFALISETGNKITLEINSTTYELTAKLYDKNNNLISTSNIIDLPLESIITSATYYDTYTYDGTTYNKVIVLVLSTTSVPTIIPVASLVSGLQAEITAQNKLSSDYVDDNNKTNEFIKKYSSSFDTSLSLESLISFLQTGSISNGNYSYVVDFGNAVARITFSQNNVNEAVTYLFIEIATFGSTKRYSLANVNGGSLSTLIASKTVADMEVDEFVIDSDLALVELTGTGGTLTDAQYNLVANAKSCLIKRDTLFYVKTSSTSGTLTYQAIYQNTTPTNSVYLQVSQININTSTKAWEFSTDPIQFYRASQTYNKSQIDSKITPITITGTSSGTLSSSELAILNDANKNVALVKDDIYYYLWQVAGGFAIFKMNYIGTTQQTNVYGVVSKRIWVNLSTGEWELANQITTDFYNKLQTDNLLDTKANVNQVKHFLDLSNLEFNNGLSVETLYSYLEPAEAGQFYCYCVVFADEVAEVFYGYRTSAMAEFNITTLVAQYQLYGTDTTVEALISGKTVGQMTDYWNLTDLDKSYEINPSSPYHDKVTTEEAVIGYVGSNLALVELTGSGGTLNDEQYNLVANAKSCVILKGGAYYHKFSEDSSFIIYQRETQTDLGTSVMLSLGQIIINKSTKVWGTNSTSAEVWKKGQVYSKNEVNALSDKSLYHLGAFDTVETVNGITTITRKTGYVDLGTLTWAYSSAYSLMYATILDKSTTRASNLAISKGRIVAQTVGYSAMQNGDCRDDYFNTARDIIYKTSETSATAFKNAMQGVLLQYELETTYTEEVIEGRPLNTLDQNGSQWLRKEWEKGLNLFEDKGNYSSQYIGNYYINNSKYSYSRVTNNNYNCYRIAVTPNTTYTLSSSDSAGTYTNIRFVDSTYTLISGNGDLYNIQSGSFTTPNNCIYIEIAKEKTRTHTLMLVEGDHAYPYQEYNGAIIHEKDITPTLLWKNGNPSADFATGEVLSNVSQLPYKYLVFEFAIVKDNLAITEMVKIKLNNLTLNGDFAYSKYVNLETDTITRNVAFISSDNKIYVSDATDTSNNTVNNYLIPVAIYGTNVL